MEIKQIFFNNDLRNFSYLIIFDSGFTICIDPFAADLIIDQIPINNKIHLILNSHDHYDHHAGNDLLIKKYDALVYTHLHSKISQSVKHLHHQEIIYEFGSYQLIAIDSPGHTINHLMFLLLKDKIPYAIFTGDCFFNAGVGNCYNGGDVKLLYQTIKNQFSHFPDELLIYPGHEYLKKNLEFTVSLEYTNSAALEFLNKLKDKDLNNHFFINNLQTEREINLFLRLNSLPLQEKFSTKNEEDIFIKLRELRNKW